MTMLKTALLSVIIPVYNVEPYLEECLNSIINQTYKNLEIICINDGSTDNSLKILEKFQKKDKRIKLINQKNYGVSIARNIALDKVNGEYVAFLDSDDYLELTAYENAMRFIMSDKSIELVEFNINALYEKTNDIILKNRARLIMNQQVYNFNNRKYSGMVWNKIYKRSIIDKLNIRFIPNVKYGDTFFSLAYIISTKNHIFLNKQLYNYRIRFDSIIGNEYSTKFKSQMHLYKNLDELVNYAKLNNFYFMKKDFIFNEYINRIYFFTDDVGALQSTIDHWDKKILDSDCPDKLKVKYLTKRKLIKNRMKRIAR